MSGFATSCAKQVAPETILQGHHCIPCFVVPKMIVIGESGYEGLMLARQPSWNSIVP